MYKESGQFRHCHLADTEIIAENEWAKAFYDKFPVDAGHVLITPKRHIAELLKQAGKR